MNTLSDLQSRLAANVHALSQLQAGYAAYLANVPYLNEQQRRREQARFDMALAALEQDREFLAEEVAEAEAAAAVWCVQ